MLKIKCDRCKNRIKQLGALVFSPPFANFQVMKFHICVSCWENLYFFMKDYKLDKKIVGIAGLRCPCCNKMRCLKDARVVINRRFRRKNKQKINGSDTNS